MFTHKWETKISFEIQNMWMIVVNKLLLLSFFRSRETCILFPAEDYMPPTEGNSKTNFMIHLVSQSRKCIASLMYWNNRQTKLINVFPLEKPEEITRKNTPTSPDLHNNNALCTPTAEILLISNFHLAIQLWYRGTKKNRSECGSQKQPTYQHCIAPKLSQVR